MIRLIQWQHCRWKPLQSTVHLQTYVVSPPSKPSRQLSLSAARHSSSLYLISNGIGIKEAPRGVCAPLIPENNALISPNLWKKIYQLPESNFPLLPKSLKIIQLLPNPQKYKPILPKMYFSFHRIKFTYLKTMKLYTSGWLNIHLIFYVILVKIGLSHRINDNYLNEMHNIYSSKYETILKILLLYLVE